MLRWPGVSIQGRHSRPSKRRPGFVQVTSIKFATRDSYGYRAYFTLIGS